MPIFKAFFKSLKKRCVAVVIYIAIFTIIGVVISNMTSDEQTGYKATKINVAVFDYDNSTYSTALKEYVENNHNLISVKDDDNVLLDELFNREVDYILRIQKGFSDDFTKMECIKSPNSTTASLLDAQINQYLKIVAAYDSDSSYSDKKVVELADQSSSKNVDIEYMNFSKQEGKESEYYYFLYLPYLFIAIMIISLGGLLLIFRNQDIGKRIQCSCMSMFKRNIYLSLCCMIYSVGVWLLFMIIAYCLMGNYIFSTKGLYYMLNSIAIMLFSVMITFFLSFYAKNDNVLNAFANVIGLGMSFLCGVFVPLELLGENVKNVAHFLPVYWYVENCEYIDSFTSNESVMPIFNAIGIQLLFAVTFLALALASSKLKKRA